MANDTHPRHIILPFDLRERDQEDGCEHGCITKEERKMLLQVFPGAFSVWTFEKAFLTVILLLLPPKPWPLTIAGKPVLLEGREHVRALPPFRGALGHIIDEEDWDFDGYNWPLDPDYYVVDYFKNALFRNTDLVTEFFFVPNDDCIYIVLRDRDTDMARLPTQFRERVLSYVYEDEMDRPKGAQAQRFLNLQPGNLEDEDLFERLEDTFPVYTHASDSSVIDAGHMLPSFRVAPLDANTANQEGRRNVWIESAWF